MDNKDVKQENLKIAEHLSKNDFIREWIANTSSESTDPPDNDDASSVVSSSIVESEDLEQEFKSIKLGTDTSESSLTQGSEFMTTVLQQISNNIQNLDNVVIQNSSGVHVGHVFNIHINGNGSTKKESKEFREEGHSDEEEKEERMASSDAFIGGNVKRNLAKKALRYVERREWLAQKAMEPYTKVKTPVPYVVISHTATESGDTIADNKFLIRHVQCFHIESRKFIDIAYNFLVGCDGVVYEGRGWGVEGAHTYGYNRRSVGISFVGCFMQELPPRSSLDVLKVLIQKGIDENFISKDYRLVGHCQCTATESPGRALFEEIKTWPHFYEVDD